MTKLALKQDQKLNTKLQLWDSFLKTTFYIDSQKTIIPGTIKLYSCGPTVYGYQHIGNMRAVWLPDIIVNLAKILGFKTNWVLNITDVGHLVGDVDTGEDKMEKTAKSQGKSVDEIVTFYTNDYFKQTKALNFSLPNNLSEVQMDVNVGIVNPKATDFIKEQMILAVELLAHNKAYMLEDGIYFDSEANKDLVVPFTLNNADSSFNSRDIVNSDKNPNDFALWKFVEENSLQKWKIDDFINGEDVVFSKNILEVILKLDHLEGKEIRKLKTSWGCPGWHSECVAMICGILGRRLVKKRDKFSFADFENKTIIDLHTGGEDHIEIHHRNEILQSEALGFHLAQNWIHNKFVLVENKKMSKSLGNLYLVAGTKEQTGYESIESQGFDPLAYRLLLHEHMYDSQLDFRWDKLQQSQTRLFNMRKEASKIQSFTKVCKDQCIEGSFFELEKIETEWLTELCNNLNLPKFLELYTQFLTSVSNLMSSEKILGDKDLSLLKKYDLEFLKLDIFGITIPVEIIKLATSRQLAKSNKEYQKSDDLRAQISKLGWQIDDYTWGFGLWSNQSLESTKSDSKI